jgi:glycosyltransferase involved in cell wall biosynthesis
MVNAVLDLSVIIPVRNAEHLIEECLAPLVQAEPREIIVVDGMSTDRTLEIAGRYPVKIISDEGRGVAAARTMGIQAAQSPYVALIDVDIVMKVGDLAALFDEFAQGHYSALQAGLLSVAGPGYWGRALVDHHRRGRSKNWPGVMATIFDREVLLKVGFDERFISGEDIELRWRLRDAGLRLGVSQRTVVTHRYEDTFDFARGQWLADGKGLGRMVSKYGWRSVHLLGIPLAGSVRGILLSLRRLQPLWIPYYLSYLVYNYIGIVGGIRHWKQQAAAGK